MKDGRKELNYKQLHRLLHLRDHGPGWFDRLYKLIVRQDGRDKALTPGNSTIGFTLFRRGWIATDGETVEITERGRKALKDFGL